MIKRLGRLLGRLFNDRRGNVIMLTGMSIVPLVTAAGVGIDYSRAARAQTKLNAAADAAALSAVSQAMMPKTDAEAKALAEFVFAQQAQSMKDVVWDSSMLSVTISHTGTLNADRNAVVTYTAKSKNSFANIVGMATVTIGGTSKANATRAPNIDFYLLLDTSPSMALPATTAGLAQMTAKTKGCAFACHQTDVSTATDTINIGTSQKPNYVSYYTWAKSQGISLRVDLVQTSVEDLVDVAKETAVQNNAKYQMALAQFDYKYNNLVASPTAMDTVKSQAPNAKLLPYCKNSQRVCGTGDNDTASDFTKALAGALTTLPATAGNGTSTSGDTPQAVLFLITDGMRDEENGGRKMGPIPTAQCTTIKNRGVRIAILYTEYLPESASDSWSVTNVKNPYLDPNDNISPALLSCASPGLFYTVTTDGDISASLAALFRQAVATAHLIQ